MFCFRHLRMADLRSMPLGRFLPSVRCFVLRCRGKLTFRRKKYECQTQRRLLPSLLVKNINRCPMLPFIFSLFICFCHVRFLPHRHDNEGRLWNLLAPDIIFHKQILSCHKTNSFDRRPWLFYWIIITGELILLIIWTHFPYDLKSSMGELISGSRALTLCRPCD